MRRALPLFVLLAACGGEVTMVLPDGFVRLPENDDLRLGYAYRATTADGVVLGVRDIDTDASGGLSFWEQAVTTALERAGYAKLDRGDVRAASGQPAVLLRFGRDVERHAYDYWLMLCVEDERVVIVEVGGDRERFTPIAEAIAAALTTVRLE